MTITGSDHRVVADDVVATFPLTRAQERIWLQERLTPRTPAFTIAASLAVTGAFDPDALREATGRLVERHETLRTRFVERDGSAVQEVLDEVAAPVEVLTCADHAAVERAAAESAGSGFDIAVAPLLRVRLVQEPAGPASLVVAMHHLVCDGTSADILLRDLVAYYRAAVTGTPAQLPELSVQFGDFAAWQRDTDDAQQITDDLAFWRDELAGTDGSIDLPSCADRAQVPDHRGAVMHRDLDAATSSAILAGARAARVSPFMFVLAAYELVLCRLSGRTDFCVGVAMSQRNREELAHVFGCFITMVPLRADVRAGLTVHRLLRAVRERCLRAFSHTSAPFEQIVQEVLPAHDRTRSPLFDVVLAVQQGRVTSIDVPGGSLTPVPVPAEIAQFDLAVDVAIDEGGARVSLCYATGLYDRPVAQELLTLLTTTLREMVADANRPVADLFAATIATAAATDVRALERVAAEHARAADDARPGDVVYVSEPDAPGRALACAVALSREASVVAPLHTDPPAWQRETLVHIPVSAPSPRLFAASGPAVDQPSAATAAEVSAGVAALADAFCLRAGEQFAAGHTAAITPVLAAWYAGAHVVAADHPVDVPAARAGCFPASTWRSALATGWRPSGSYTAVLAADPHDDLADRLRHAGCTVVVAAHTADATVCYAIERDLPDGTSRRPVPGLPVVVLDAIGAPALPGVVGRLTVGDPPRPTGDLVVTGADGIPGRLAGRADAAALLDGEVVDLVSVENLVATIPGVHAVTAAVSDEQRLVLFCTPESADAAGIAAQAADLVPARFGSILVRAVDSLPDPDGIAAALAEVAHDADGAGSADSPTLPRDQLERDLLDCFVRALGRSDIGVDHDFFLAGGTSLAAARVVAELSRAARSDIALKTLFAGPTVTELAATVRDSVAARSGAVAQASADAVLPDDIVVAPARTGAPRRALLTGATGFLGSHLLVELVASGLDEVVCVVRGADEAAARAALQRAIDRYRVTVDADRVRVVAGDLSARRLGLDAAAFGVLAREVDVVYHCGAQVSFALPYAALRQANVLGTLEIVRLAATHGTPVHFVSTIDGRLPAPVREFPAPLDRGADEGYVLSKKTAECLVLAAGRGGLPVSVYRPWQVTAATTTGAVGADDQWALCLRGSMALGALPADLPTRLRVLPVDVVARTIVQLASASSTASAEPRIHHLFNPAVTDLPAVQAALARAGHDLAVVPFEQWRARLARRQAGSADALSTLLAIQPTGDNDGTTDDIATETTVLRLGHEPDWPALDDGYVARLTAYLCDGAKQGAA